MSNLPLENDFVAVIPAAGRGTRISPSPCSKEIYPVGWQTINGKKKPKVISQYLLESLRSAGISKAFIVIRDDKWDIPKYYKDGGSLNMNIAYIVTEGTKGHPFTLAKALSFVKDSNVAFGFPDIYFQPCDAFTHLVHHYHKSKPDVLLGLFPVSEPSKHDLVHISNDWEVTEINLRGNKEVGEAYTWIFSLWGPKFTQFISDYLQSCFLQNIEETELMLDHIFLEALSKEFRISALPFDDGYYLDIGTEEGIENLLTISKGT